MFFLTNVICRLLIKVICSSDWGMKLELLPAQAVEVNSVCRGAASAGTGGSGSCRSGSPGLHSLESSSGAPERSFAQFLCRKSQ